MINIRRASESDLPFLIQLEEESFQQDRRSSKQSLKNSIKSYRQKVWILESENVPVASAIVFLHKNSIRLYSIAVSKKQQGKSYGKTLLDYIIDYAKDKAFLEMVLEVDVNKPKLVNWYSSLGFNITSELKDFYGVNYNAYKMKKVLFDKKQIIKNIVVVDKHVHWLKEIENIEVVTSKEYIVLEKYQKAQRTRIFNLCSSYAYQSMGYYVSLLASARKQRIIPNVATIKDFSDQIITESIADDLFEEMQKAFSKIKENTFVLNVYFGNCMSKKFENLAKKLYKLFEAPFIEFIFTKTNDWDLTSAKPLAMEEIEFDEKIIDFAKKYFNQKKYIVSRFKDFKYNLAILVDPNELTPPSCRMALKNFMHAAEKIGFYTEFITKEDYSRLTEFDALFIRTTTNVNDYTYQFSRYAYAEGLTVIDDPWSILKCANKIFLSENMKKEGVKTPVSILIGKGTDYNKILDDLSFPIVLKEPDNAFCLGVFKVDNMASLTKTLNEIFEKSELVLAQEFVKSDFDWRIGVLDNTPLFACKYYMAEKHWQITKWNKTKSAPSYGKYETLPLEKVPKEVIKTALKAANAMGDGLYGVDLKEVNGSVYVIEVNDNPNIDYRVEDKILKRQLYHKIIYSIYRRLELSSGIKRYVSNENKVYDRK